MAYGMGRTLVGYGSEGARCGRLVRVARQDSMPVGVVGVGEGGRVALYAAAVDERIKAVQVAACAFGSIEAMYDEPLDHGFWGALREFSDAEVAALIYPGRADLSPRGI